MSWLLAGYCGLALINISGALRISQWPWFIGVKTNRDVYMVCEALSGNWSDSSQWYKANEFTELKKAEAMQPGERIKIQKGRLHIRDVHVEDKGLYFCKINNTWGTGTELNIARPINNTQPQYRTKMKDGLMIFQGLLLAMCIAAILLRKQTLSEKTDSIYEEPETDHIYEGLTIDSCGGDLYDELTAYSQPEGVEAPWE
uniref:Ig-like domain-containing protein n=1 Tax=Mola mola TaxID=94237 RepID=A0A3Q3XFS2_MOLML